MPEISRQEVIMPGGIELTQEAESHLRLQPDTRMLSVACGTGELELYLAEKYGCYVTGIDTDEGFIAGAKKKAMAGRLAHRATFETGDGNTLRFASESFDLVFCSGALCAFFDRGLKEFYRVLKPRGRTVIIEVVWRREDVPEAVKHCWTEGTAHILTVTGNQQAFADRGFRTLLVRAYHEPSWWAAYYQDRGDAPHWQAERQNYQAHQDYLGLGIFILEKVQSLPK